jgi:hypothetical protein
VVPVLLEIVLPFSVSTTCSGALISKFVGPTVPGVLLVVGKLLGVELFPASSNSIVYVKVWEGGVITDDTFVAPNVAEFSTCDDPGPQEVFTFVPVLTNPAGKAPPLVIHHW